MAMAYEPAAELRAAQSHPQHCMLQCVSDFAVCARLLPDLLANFRNVEPTELYNLVHRACGVGHGSFGSGRAHRSSVPALRRRQVLLETFC